MRLFADENTALAIVKWLRDESHDVEYAAEMSAGEDDPVWLNHAELSG